MRLILIKTMCIACLAQGLAHTSTRSMLAGNIIVLSRSSMAESEDMKTQNVSAIMESTEGTPGSA